MASESSNADDTASTSHRGVFNWQRLVGFLLVAGALAAFLPWTEAQPNTTRSLTAQFALRDAGDALSDALRHAGATSEAPVEARLRYDGPEGSERAMRRELSSLELLKLDDDTSDIFEMSATIDEARNVVSVEATLQRAEGEATALAESTRRLGGWEALLPPLLAILIALFFRRLLIGLFSAVWLGAALQHGFNPITATWETLSTYLFGNLADSFNLYIIGFTFALVGMVHVMIRMGGIAGILKSLAFLARSARSTRVATALMGLALFFDDYANTIVVGSTMRPLTDEQNISREKLAYLVDSTSAPIAGLAVVSTWIGYEVGLFGQLSEQLQLGMSGYEIFFAALPMRFYCIFALVFAFLIAIWGKDFGPMLQAERRAYHDGEVHDPEREPMRSSHHRDTEPKEDVPHRWYNAVLPVVCVIVATILGMYWSGWRGDEFAHVPGLGGVIVGDATWSQFGAAWASALPEMGTWTVWRSALSEAANAKVLFWASLFGSGVAIGLAVGQRLLTVVDALRAWSRTIPMMGLAVAILLLAWSIQDVCSDLGTSIYLVGAVQHILAPAILPLMTFALAALVAFATGTSWGTMGILLPAMIPLAFHITAQTGRGGPVLMMCFAAVLDGAIFGDHCSPISDTTIMSSIASSVDHIAHVETQLPYALTSMTAAALFGYVGVAFGIPIVIAFLLGLAFFGIILWSFAVSPRESPPAPELSEKPRDHTPAGTPAAGVPTVEAAQSDDADAPPSR
jgi:Na+/H+ antiporter NhaC